jgi:hypothetical protein
VLHPYQPNQLQNLQVPSSGALDKRPQHAVKSKVLASSSTRAGGVVRPHWMSHMQQGVPASLRDEAVRLHWQRAAVQLHGG